MLKYNAKNDYQMSQLREWAKMTRNCLSGKSDKFTKLIKLDKIYCGK